MSALFVQKGGVYFGLEGVDPWDETRDARLYAGPHPVVAHPPCARWCRLAGLVEARYGYKRGEDGGCFASALASVRRWGGVLEHPAYSDAFRAHGLPPPHPGGWQRIMCGGWVSHVEQWHYGHPARKATWLFAFGVAPPSLMWTATPEYIPTAYVTDGGGDVKRRHQKNPTAYVSNVGGRQRQRALVSWCNNHVKDGEQRRRLGSREASASPVAFRDLLISIARSAQKAEAA